MEEIIELRNIRLFRNGFELEVDNFSVEKGEIVCILGENGAGKTTLLSVLALLTRPDSGEIFLMGKNVKGFPDAVKNVTMVFQKPVLLSGSVYDNVLLPIKWYKKSFDRERVELLMEKFGIIDIKGKKAREISAGEAQRACLVRALLLNPKILILDEPFSSIDPISSHEIISEIVKIAKKEEITIIFSTHEPEEAVHAERIGIMEKGKIVQIGNFKEVFFKPVNEKVAKILGSVNVILGEIKDWRDGIGKVKSNYKEIEVLTEIKEGDVAIFLRPENLILSKEFRQTSARNNFKCEVKGMVYREVGVEVVLDCGFPLISFITRPSLENLNLKIGDSIYASFKASSIHVVRK